MKVKVKVWAFSATGKGDDTWWKGGVKVRVDWLKNWWLMQVVPVERSETEEEEEMTFLNHRPKEELYRSTLECDATFCQYTALFLVFLLCWRDK